MQSAKETASNVAASAKAGMEKTKATVQEKAEKMTTRDPLQKDMSTQKKEERIHEAERQKQETRQHNAASKQAGGITGEYSTGGDFTTGTGQTGTGYTAEAGQLGSGHPHGTTEGLLGSTQDPLGPTAGTGRVGHRDPNTGRTGYGSGKTY